MCWPWHILDGVRGLGPFITVLDGIRVGVGVCAGLGPFIIMVLDGVGVGVVLDGVGIGIRGLGPFAIVLVGVGIDVRGLGLLVVVLDGIRVGVRVRASLVVVLDGVGVGVGVRAGLDAFIVVLDGVRGLGPFAVVLDVASALVFVLVLARSLLYSMASALGWVLACSSVPVGVALLVVLAWSFLTCWRCCT